MATKFNVQKAVREKIFAKIAIMSPSGGGKALTMDSDLMTPNGVIKMRDVKAGDKVFGTDGKPHNVIGVYPQGEKPCYRVTFSDGTYVNCSEDHLWTVRRRENNKYFTVALSEILNTPLNDKGWLYFIPMTEPVEYMERDLEIDPYIMGKTIGIENVECLDETDPITRGISYRRIPRQYKLGSVKQRVELLQGLIDTDGEVCGKNNSEKSEIIFSTTSKQLADDVIFVVNSLGGTASISNGVTHYTMPDGNLSRGFDGYRLYIKMPKGMEIFKSEKHKSACYDPMYNPCRSIRDISYIGNLECQCIEVDSEDHLFLTNNFVATHNTFSSLRMASGMAQELEKVVGHKGRILVANTEGARGRYYANEFDYDIVDLEPPYNPEMFVDLISYAVQEKYDILILDSSSAEWEGKGGCLELQQMAGGTYQSWAKVTPRHDKFIQAIASSPIHIIATMRGKDQYEIEKDDKGKTNVKKLGVGAKQRDGFEYEFTCTFTVDVDSHLARSQKDNTHIFDAEGLVLLTEEHGKKIIDWANSGEGFNTSARKFESQVAERGNDAELNEKKKQIADTINTILDSEKLTRNDISEVIKNNFSIDGRPSAVYTKCTDICVLDKILKELITNL